MVARVDSLVGVVGMMVVVVVLVLLATENAVAALLEVGALHVAGEKHFEQIERVHFLFVVVPLCVLLCELLFAQFFLGAVLVVELTLFWVFQVRESVRNLSVNKVLRF